MDNKRIAYRMESSPRNIRFQRRASMNCTFRWKHRYHILSNKRRSKRTVVIGK